MPEENYEQDFDCDNFKGHFFYNSSKPILT